MSNIDNLPELNERCLCARPALASLRIGCLLPFMSNPIDFKIAHVTGHGHGIKAGDNDFNYDSHTLLIQTLAHG